MTDNWWLLIFVILLTCITPSDHTTCDTEKCTCSRGYSGKYEYNCQNQNGTVTVEIDPSGILKLFCSQNDLDLNFEWSDLVNGINTSHAFYKLTIHGCSVPNLSFKKIFLNLNIDLIKTIEFESHSKVRNIFQSFHFEHLKSVQNLNLPNNGITSLPDNMLEGTPNLIALHINHNDIAELTPEFFKSTPKLKILNLGQNNLTTLQPGLFKHVPNLVFLNVYFNKLKNFKRETFSNLKNLISLDLSRNGITKFDDDIFRDLSLLQELNLSYNNINILPKELFVNVSSLKKIRITQSYNLEFLKLPEGLFFNLSLAEEISLDSNNISVLPENLFYKTTKLKILLLKQNLLSYLPKDIFKDTTELTELDISNNKLKIINDTVFHSLKKLVKLRLDNNLLEFINRSVFSKLSSLEELNLQHNKLLSIETGAFGHLGKLKIIDLSNNRLSFSENLEFGYSPLHECINIEKINLRNNSVNIIFPDWTNTHVKLKLLDLSYNKLQNLEVNDFQFLSTNFPVTVNFSNNEISSIDLSGLETYVNIQCISTSCDDNNLVQNREIYFTLKHNPINCDCHSYYLAKYLQNKMNHLVYNFMKIHTDKLICHSPANLKNALISEIDLCNLQCPWKIKSHESSDCPNNCTCFFRPHDDTVVVNCSYTNMKSFPDKLPKARSVKGIELLLSNNDITYLSGWSKVFPHFNITKLSLSHNRLKDINELEIPSTLKILELDNNNLSYLSKEFVDKMNTSVSLNTICLHNNQWKCDCDTKYLLNFLQKRFKLVPHLNNITCVETGTSIIQLSVDDLCNFSLTIISIGVLLALSGVLFGIVIILYHRYQHEIKVWMFSHKIFLWLVTEKEIDKHKKYDAFISYSHLDEEFVVNYLVPELEKGSHPFKLCLHFRDWIAGEFIPNQIIRSVEDSRRTIVLLSPNFLKSVWGKMEFRIAHLKAIKEKCARVIIILLNDIGSIDKLDAELKAYLTMNTYVKWGDPWFWKKLKYALPHPQEFSRQNKQNNM